MIYYSVVMYTDKTDDIDYPRNGLNGGVTMVKWLRYSGDDNRLQLNEKREDENLAIQIFIQNLQKNEVRLLFTNDPDVNPDDIGKKRIEVRNEKELLELLHGQYEKVIVEKYESDLNIR